MTLRWQVPGVSRVARITGLDRSGIEVACAIRPRGHVLQVCNGKGLSAEAAMTGALLEAAELACAEATPSPLRLIWSSRTALLGAAVEPVWALDECGSAGQVHTSELATDDIVMAWCRGIDLMQSEQVWLPAQAVYCPMPGTQGLGPVALGWTTNGMGAHPIPARALAHALLEAVERSELARAMPDGWTQAIVRERRLDWSAHPKAQMLARALASRGLTPHLFEARPRRNAISLPVMAALLVDEEGGPVALTAGYACRMDADEAALSALLEAAQSRLTEIHGAREEVASQKPDVAPLIEWLAQARPVFEFDDEDDDESLASSREHATPEDAAAEVDAAEVALASGKATEDDEEKVVGIGRFSRHAQAPEAARPPAAPVRTHLHEGLIAMGAGGQEEAKLFVKRMRGGRAPAVTKNPEAELEALLSLGNVANLDASLIQILAAISRAGYDRVAAVPMLEGAPPGVAVVKVVIPQFERSELL